MALVSGDPPLLLSPIPSSHDAGTALSVDGGGLCDDDGDGDDVAYLSTYQCYLLLLVSSSASSCGFETKSLPVFLSESMP